MLLDGPSLDPPLMKPSLTLTALLLSALPAFASEAWLLEMDARFHEALMKRFAEGDPAACRHVTDKLPELVKSGKIKELESISTDSATGGKVHPSGQFMMKASDGTENPTKIGSTYSGGSGLADGRRLQIKSKGEGLGAKLGIQVTGRLSKAWQPVFSVESGGIVRVLMERDPAAEEEFWKPLGLLTLSAPVPEKMKITWVLGEGNPALPAAEGEAGDIPGLAEFHEITTRTAKASRDDWRDFGTVVKWAIAASAGPTYDLSVTLEDKGASTAARQFDAKGSLGKGAAPAKSSVTTFVQKFDKKGEHYMEDEDGKEQGEAEASLIRLPR